jgi:hypothetical protein
MLPRLTEVAVVLDRAAALEERGHEAQAAIVFDPDVSPRNIAIVARAPLTAAEAPRDRTPRP